MIPIQYNKSELVPPLVGNPFIVCSVELKIVLPGRIVMVNTGLSITLPDGCVPIVLGSKRDDLAALHATIHNGSLHVAMTHIGDADAHFIRPADTIAMVAFGKVDYEDVRFVEVREGKMLKYGDASPTGGQGE